MNGGSSRLYNAISVFFVLLTIAWIIVVIYVYIDDPNADNTPEILTLPTAGVVPTMTDTPLSRPTLPPTFTATASPTLTPTPTPTLTPSVTPSVTITNTGLPPTATSTPTPTITFTPSTTPTLTATATNPPTLTLSPTHTPSLTFTPSPTLSPFLFDLDGDGVTFMQNFANSAGCAWQGIGGQVFGLQGEELGGFRVHVFDQFGTFDRVVLSGTNSLYGRLSGWEIPVANATVPATIFIELRSPQGTTVISPLIEVAFPGSCGQNLAIVNFVQQRPFS